MDSWRSLPPGFEFSLEPAEVHVWLAPLEVGPALSRLQAYLSAEEIAKASRLRATADRKSALASRGILRELLGGYLQTAPATITFACNAFGKPRLAGPLAEADLSFNLSHSHQLAVFAFARSRLIGVDVERIRPEAASDEVAAQCLAPGELMRLRSLPRHEQVSAFFDCWTRKEAYLKACGDGLMRGLDTFEVAFGRGTVPAILRAHQETAGVGNWSVVNLPVGNAYAAALVVEGPCRIPNCFRWTDVNAEFLAPRATPGWQM